MRKFKSFKCTNGFSYKEFDIELDRQGLVLIDGDSGHGKSSIWELLTHNLYGQTTRTGVRNNLIVNKYVDKNYFSELQFENLGKQYKFQQYRKHETLGTGVSFYEDGLLINNKKNRSENGDTQKIVADKIDLSYQEFLGTVYLCQNYTHDLINGTPSAKKNYLVKYFGLEKLDQLLLDIETKSKSVAVNSNLEVYDQIIERIQEDIKSNPSIEELDKQVVDLKSKDADLFGKIKVLKAQVTAYLASKQVYTSYKQKIESLKSHELYDEQFLPVHAQKELEEKLQRMEVINAILENSRVYFNAIEKLKHETQYHPSELVGFEKTVADSKSIIADYQADRPKIEKLNKLLSNLVSPGSDWSAEYEDKIKSLETKIAGLQATINVTQTEIDKLAKLQDQCFTCLRPVDAETKNSWIDERKALLTTLNKTLLKSKATKDVLQTTKQEHDNYQKIVNDIESLKSSMRKEQSAYEGIEAVQSIMQAAQAKIDANKRFDAVTATIPKLDLRIPLDVAKKEVVTVRERIAQLKDYVKLGFSLGTEPVYDPSNESLIGDLEQLEEQHSNIKSTLAELSYKHSTVMKCLADLKKAENDRAEAKSKQVRHKILNTLTLSLKDLKMLKLHNSTKLLVNVLPTYISMLFKGEKVSVEVSEEEDSCDIVFNKSECSIPLESLSMGQGKRLGLAILFACTRLLNRQSNILICDEPVTSLDAKSRAACFEILKDLMDPTKPGGLSSIFVMSHEQDLKSQKFDQRWKVDYDGETSTLIL